MSLTHQSGTDPLTLPSSGNLGDLFIGTNDAVNFSNGLIDEVYVSNFAYSDDYILSQYNNQKPGSTFLTWGALTPVSGSGTGSPNLLLLGVG